MTIVYVYTYSLVSFDVVREKCFVLGLIIAWIFIVIKLVAISSHVDVENAKWNGNDWRLGVVF